MKRLFIHSIYLLILFLLSSCLNIVEEVRLKDDGSGLYHLTFDFKGIYNVPSFEAIMEEMTWEEEERYGSNLLMSIDTTIYFKDLIIGFEEELERPEFWENVLMHTTFNRDEQKLLFEIEAEFEQLSDIDYFYKDFNKIQSISRSQPEEGGAFSTSGGDIGLTSSGDQPISFVEGILFELSKKSFIRHPVKRWENTIDSEQLQFLKQFMPNAIYKTIYHLPGKIKKSSIPNSTFKDNILIAEYPLLDIYEGEVNLEGEIKFK